MPQQGLDETQVRPVFQEVGREGMPQAVDATEFSEAGFFAGSLENQLEGPSGERGAGLAGFEDEGLWPVTGEVLSDGGFQAFRKHDNPILSSFSVPDADDLPGEI